MNLKKYTLAAMAFAACTLMAEAQDFKPMEDVNNVVDLTLDSLEKANNARPVSGSSRVGSNPVLFLVGNSTMRTGTMGNGDNGQWGWGRFAQQYFDKKKITVENHALGGTSSRTFYKQLWPAVKQGIRPGDFVVIELGHNDNGPFDSGRARASIKGVSGRDSLIVTIKETGRIDTVYSYGEYMRRFVREVKALGATPILMSLTPRNAKEDNGRVTRVDNGFGLWAGYIAAEESVPFVNLNELSASQYEQFSQWKMDYHFYLDKIHTSEFGANLNARSAARGIRDCQHPLIAPLRDMMLEVEPEKEEVKRVQGRPVVFLAGDSTVKNQDNDENGMWGWGAVAEECFDTTKISVCNAAMAGRSTRTFLEEGRWDKVYNALQPGDYVLIQFGHNDIGDIDKGKARGVLPMAQDSSSVFHINTASEQRNRVIYSFGWYLKKFIDDCREKGATPILVSLTPRNIWKDGHIERQDSFLGTMYRQVVAETGVELVDLHNISADFLDKKGEKRAAAYYNHDHTHTSLTGARQNAKNVAKGLKANKSPLAKYVK